MSQENVEVIDSLVTRSVDALHQPNLKNKIGLLCALNKYMDLKSENFEYRFKARVARSLLLQNLQEEMD